MGKFLVTGGTGVLGRVAVERLRAGGHEVRVLSRRAGAGTHVGDLVSGAGVGAAAAGVDAIVHAASNGRRFGNTDVAQTDTVIRAATEAGVGNLVYVSIVGIERIPFRYYRNKVACERRIVESGVPHTILRATQFHELIASALFAAGRLPITPLPLDFRFQPVAAAEVAVRTAELATGTPLGFAPDFGGPEVLTLRELIDIWRQVHARPRVVPMPLPGRIAKGFRAGFNTCPEHTDGTLSWADYVRTAVRDPYAAEK
ncbi:SDR family oxidoreductase [Nocardia sp. NPDC058058]|uniref:SDR family oxidoreductase n=1 Tax=Nocardia sp. NPDC058058 TaxID=3346317 RepID=UPI0036DF82F1